MNPYLRQTVVVLIGVAYSVVAALALRAGGASRLWKLAPAVAVLLAALVYVQWRSVSVHETPLSVHILSVTVPVIGVSGLIQGLARIRTDLPIQMFVGAVAWFVLHILSLVSLYVFY